MASIGKIERNKKIIREIKKHKQKRQDLKKAAINPNLSIEERLKAQNTLKKMNPWCYCTRVRNRCNITGDPRAYLSRYGLSRNDFRKLVLHNLIPGVKKASW